LKPARIALPPASDVPSLARAVAAAGGRIVVVGGFVRDALRGGVPHDLDLEVFGLRPEAVEDTLASFGFSVAVGRHFPVWRRNRDGLDLAHPREGALDYHADAPSSLADAFRKAARHRDLTVDAIGFDPLADCLLDPFGGVSDLEAARLRAVDPETFVEDPIRVLRVARLAAALEAEPDPALIALCRELSLEGVAVERIANELRRILLDLRRPSRAFEALARLGRLDTVAPIARLVGVPQDPTWHPEGDVFVHTLLVLDRARVLADALGPEEAEILMLAALCHDLGKPETTTHASDGRIRSIAHEGPSARRAGDWLRALRFRERSVRAVVGLVEVHLAPSQLVRQSAGPRAYRRLARKLEPAGVSLTLLEKLARADHLGRTTPEALADRYDAGAAFLAAAEAAQVERGPRVDFVQARDLIARGVAPGPELGRLLRRCRELEDRLDVPDPEAIVARVLGERRRPPGGAGGARD
jgi:tRNA nucleotidyltransferase (CCA-adding enzyme)